MENNVLLFLIFIIVLIFFSNRYTIKQLEEKIKKLEDTHECFASSLNLADPEVITLLHSILDTQNTLVVNNLTVTGNLTVGTSTNNLTVNSTGTGTLGINIIGNTNINGATSITGATSIKGGLSIDNMSNIKSGTNIIINDPVEFKNNITVDTQAVIANWTITTNKIGMPLIGDDGKGSCLCFNSCGTNHADFSLYDWGIQTMRWLHFGGQTSVC